ncbi:hypothetical protein ASPWEDRAFT_50826 [Aspergillus wentii DTO 134E9]|uniref:MATE efflux family protein n=1 Tax=Aspergillus wentii DTO 134E9 TaxID=1073089 RepID=A0A1L9RSC7_ASPWE|nr:uncharacterized protein ASPWEDRAFT_50826 [Aspergillus wentii DTO 134E9]OJJ37737.1 hypothetical protein ASPWEDRAFT_50826 [Aspergillus wentii DTO 134E9]
MGRSIPRSFNAGDTSPFNRPFANSPPIAEAAIARDLADYADDEGSTLTADNASDTSTVRPANPHSLTGSYRRPSFFATVSRATVVPHRVEQENITPREREQAIEEERRLLSDNHIIEDNKSGSGSLQHKFSGIFSRSREASTHETASQNGHFGESIGRQSAELPTETTSLLDTARDGHGHGHEAVVAGLIHTTWQREAKVISKYAAPLIVTFVLQYSLTVASVFTLGHMGKKELGAVSLASMTASITGYAVYQGLATSLDTLCAQAYGSGRKKLVGLQMQKMVFFLWVVTVPISVLWFFADRILMKIVPEQEVAALAGVYLKVLILGAPGYASFEIGKRYMQAQGLFSASFYVLLICAPLNAFMNWLFVWKLEWGFIGAPIAVSITNNLMPLCLITYACFVSGHECWDGINIRAFRNWGPMIKLALPGLLMVEAEYLAFEVLTLASSHIDSTALAAQSVLATISSLTFQVPFPVSISGSTRIANLIGAGLPDSAKISAKVTMAGAVIVGLFNMLTLSSLRFYIPRLFTSDEEVIELIAMVLPLCAAFQLFDALAANCNGILRGLGRQEIGGYVQIFAYYAVAMPISFGTTFGLGWGLLGLWTGVAIALCLVSFIEGIFLSQANWDRSVQEAQQRNAMA